MKVWRIVAVLVLCLILLGSIACNPSGGSDQEEVSSQLVEVVRGDLTVSVSGAGNIAVANEENLTFESSSGRVDKIHVRVGDKVSEGDVLAELAPLDTDTLELALTQARINLIQAQISLQSAKDDLEEAQSPYTDDDIDEAEEDVEEAQEELDDAEDRLAEAKREGDFWDIRYWRGEVYQAQANLIAAEDELVAMFAPSDEDSVAVAEMRVEAAELSLEQAQGELEQAEEELNNEIITAPWDGVVADVGAEVGDTFHSSTAAGTVIIHLIDPAVLELPVQVDEIDILKIKLNQRAVVSIDALPGVKLEGSVTAISPVPAATGGVVLYDVTIGLTALEGTDLKVGMSATADIAIGERSNVLLVLTRAIKQDGQGNSIVMVHAGGELQPRPVITGLSDGSRTEILDGLSEGEIVVIEMQAEAEPSSRPPRIPGMSGITPGVHPGA